VRGLLNEKFDLVIIEHSLSQDFTGLKRYLLPDDEMLLVASPNLGIDADEGLVDLQDLTRFRLYARRDGCSSKELLRNNLAATGCALQDFSGVVVSDDLRFTIQSILASAGVAYISRELVKDYLDSGQLIGLRVRGFDHRRGRSVVLPLGRPIEGLLKELVDCTFQVVTPFWRPQLVSTEEGDTAAGVTTSLDNP